MEPTTEALMAHHWKAIHERTCAAKMRIATSMGAAGWIGSLEVRTRIRIWERISRETLQHLMMYRLLHNYNLGLDVGKWLNWGTF